MHKIKRLFFTLKQISFLQIVCRLIYIIKRKIIEQFGSFLYSKYEEIFENTVLQIDNNSFFVLNNRYHYTDKIDDLLDNNFKFLNHNINFGETIDWHKDELNTGTRLWKLNLNYHEFLIDVAYSFIETKDNKYINFVEKTISEWFEQNPLGTKGYGKDNWNSYAISLRLISWIKIYQLIGNHFSSNFKKLFIKLLWIQSHFLKDNIEYDILGNHIIKNWKALKWSKFFFKTNEFDKIIKSLEKYVFIQFTKDKFHEELSPMYSAIVLEDLLEVYLIDEKSVNADLIHNLFKNINFLSFSNNYSFFNDSVSNNGVQLKDLSNFYYKVFPQKKGVIFEGDFNIDGYLGFKNSNSHLIIDMANITEGNQPAHIHCDAMSFEFSKNGNKIFTNSGTYEYNYGKRRYYSRSTESHNTLKYGDFNQSEIWGSFRVARKAKTNYKIIKHSNNSIKLIGYVSGFDFNKKIIHQREFDCSNTRMIINDTLISNNEADHSKIYYHLTPEYSISNNQIFNNKTNKFIADIFCNLKYDVVKTEYYKEFGHLSFKDTIIINSVPCNFNVKFEVQFNE